jgi:hypothetical protein
VITYSPSAPYAEELRRHTERFLAQYALGDREDLLIIGEAINQHLGDR